jgi:hypothetical protein
MWITEKLGLKKRESMQDDPRREERVPVDLEIRFRYPELFRGKVKDFCSGGIGAQVPLSLEVNSPVEMEIFQGRLLASGHVRWMRVDEDTVHVGIQFREGERDLIEQIREWKGDLT